jgi:hypothetical protein
MAGAGPGVEGGATLDHFGAFRGGIAAGLRLRHDHGRHCQVEREQADAMLDECWIACTVVTGSRERSSPNAFGCTSVSV